MIWTRRVIAGSALVMLCMAAAGPAFAGDTLRFGAQPAGGRAHFEVGYGAHVTDSLVLKNHTSKPITLTVYAANATLGDGGVVQIAFSNSQRAGLSEHLGVPGSVTIKPYQVQSVAIDVDASSFSGPAMAAVVVEDGATRAAGPLNVVERIAIIVRTALHPIASSTATARHSSHGPLEAFGWFPAPGGVIALMIWVFFKRRRRDSATPPPQAEEPAPIQAEWSSGRPVASSPVVPVRRREPVVARRRAS